MYAWVHVMNVRIWLTNFGHFPEFIHVPSDDVQKGETIEVLGTLVRHFNHLCVRVCVCGRGVRCVCVSSMCDICVCGGELPIRVTLSYVDKNLFNTKQVAISTECIKINTHACTWKPATTTNIYLLTRQRKTAQPLHTGARQSGGQHVASAHLMVALSECGRGQFVPARLIIQCLGSLQSNLYIHTCTPVRLEQEARAFT